MSVICEQKVSFFLWVKRSTEILQNLFWKNMSLSAYICSSNLSSVLPLIQILKNISIYDLRKESWWQSLFSSNLPRFLFCFKLLRGAVTKEGRGGRRRLILTSSDSSPARLTLGVDLLSQFDIDHPASHQSSKYSSFAKEGASMFTILRWRGEIIS